MRSSHEIEPMLRFAGLEFIHDTFLDDNTNLRFSYLLERHQLTKRILDAINTVLEQRGALLEGGTMVDATITDAAQVVNLISLTNLHIERRQLVMRAPSCARNP